MSGSDEISRDAGRLFDSAAGFAFEDAELRRLRYHLLRLTAIGLAREEVDELLELGRLAFHDADVSEQASKVKQRAGATDLAFAIADIVEQADRASVARRRTVMLGAALGAYAAAGAQPPSHDTVAVAAAGAVGGAVALSAGTFVLDAIDQGDLESYLSTEDR